MKTNIITVHKTIHYYHLDFEFHKKLTPTDGDHFRELFEIIVALAKTRAKIRYQTFGEKAIFIQDIQFKPSDKQITGKLRCVRRDILPEIMNTTTDEARGIDAKDEEGLVETTHFVIDCSKKEKKLALEYNQFGAKINDFVLYIQRIGLAKEAVTKLGYAPVVKNELVDYKTRIERTSEFNVKVHKDNIDKIAKIDKGVFTALKASIDQFHSEFATLSLKFDYRKKSATPEVNKSIFNLIGKLSKNHSDTELFNILSVRAEDSEKNGRLETFDLLVNKVKSEIKVEKQQRYRTIVSADIFEKMQGELYNKRL